MLSKARVSRSVARRAAVMGWRAPAAHQRGRAGLVGTSRRCLCLPGLVAVSPRRTPQRAAGTTALPQPHQPHPYRSRTDWRMGICVGRVPHVRRRPHREYLAVEPVARDLHAAAHVSASSMVFTPRRSSRCAGAVSVSETGAAVVRLRGPSIGAFAHSPPLSPA